MPTAAPGLCFWVEWLNKALFDCSELFWCATLMYFLNKYFYISCDHKSFWIAIHQKEAGNVLWYLYWTMEMQAHILSFRLMKIFVDYFIWFPHGAGNSFYNQCVKMEPFKLLVLQFQAERNRMALKTFFSYQRTAISQMTFRRETISLSICIPHF